MLKKSLIFVIFLVSILLMTGCKAKDAIVTFDSQGGSEVAAITTKVGSTIEEPTDPTKVSMDENTRLSFTGWYTTATATEDTLFDFSKEIEGDITLYAGWTQEIIVRFNTKTNATVAPKYVVIGESVEEPTAPTRTNFIFGGWFYGKPGSTWLEPEAVSFPLTVTETTQLYAYWIPTDSKAVDWADGETYKNSFTELTSDPILNPLTYHWEHESSLMAYLSTPLFGTDVDWEQAITDGLATKKGDFSSINDSNIGSLLRKNVLYGAANFPIAVGGDFDGEDGTDQNGDYSEAISREISSYTYRYNLRQDVYWEDGTQVTANDYYYTYFQYIDPVQNNYRASSYYPSADRSTGMKVVGARSYFLQGTEIGLGETDGDLAGDYGYAKITRYLGENNSLGEQYIGSWPFSNPGNTVFLSEDQFSSLGLTVGDNQVYPLGIDFGEGTITGYDIKADIELNPYYSGQKGDFWPEVSQDAVGFKVIDNFTFEMTYEVPISHSAAMANANFTLVNPTAYEASLDESGTNSTYGTSVAPAISYGPYVLKTWDTNQKMVFNKNYNSVMQKYYNYKAISFEFYPSVDSRMQAFADGKLSLTGLNQTYFSTYLENPNRKSYYNGYPQYLMFNVTEYTGQNSSTADAIKDVKFRQAFFFGFNRTEYTSTIYAPNVPTLLVYSSNATQYDNDEEWYVNTPEYAAMLADLGIDYNTYGFDPDKAKDLFNSAYSEWIAAGNSGPITLSYLSSEGAESERIDNYIISHYETLFGVDKLKFVVNRVSTEVSSDKQDSHEFDITLTGVGTGSVTNLSVMLPIVGLKFRETYGDQFGFNTTEELGIPASAFIIDESHKIDLRNTWNYLKTVTDRFNEETDSGTLWALWEVLQANDGYFFGNLDILFNFGLECTFIWAGLAPQYDGDVADRNTVTRVFDRIILEYVPLVPTAGRASSVVYASNVVCEWPAYHNIMEWGKSRYWHLSTDSDFQ